MQMSATRIPLLALAPLALAAGAHAQLEVLGSVSATNTATGDTCSHLLTDPLGPVELLCVVPGASSYSHPQYGAMQILSWARNPAPHPTDLHRTQGDSFARFGDRMFVDAPGLTGTPGTIRFRCHFSHAEEADASETYIASFGLQTQYNLVAYGGGGSDAYTGAWMHDTGGFEQGGPFEGVRDSVVAYTFGNPIEVVTTMRAIANAGDSVGPNPPGWAEAIAEVSFSIGIVEVLDANGNPVPDATVSAVSGHDYFALCEPATVASQPADGGICPSSGDAVLTIGAAGSGPVSYQWQREDPLNPGLFLALTDGPTGTGSTIVGATTETLTIEDASGDDLGLYRCTLRNDCGSDISEPAGLSEGCIADFNCGGSVNTQDVLAFLNAWAAGDASADVNGDGSVNTQDVLAFLNVWVAGCD